MKSPSVKTMFRSCNCEVNCSSTKRTLLNEITQLSTLTISGVGEHFFFDKTILYDIILWSFLTETLKLTSPSCSSTGDVVESSFISSVTPLSHFSSSAAAASLSMALQQMQQQSSYATAAGVRESLTACLHSPNEWIPTDSKKNVGPSATRSSIITGLYQLGVGNRRNSLKRSSWDLAQQQKLQPSYMSCQHVATLPRKPTHQNVQSSHHQEQQSQYGSSPPPKQNANFDVSLPSMLPVVSVFDICSCFEW